MWSNDLKEGFGEFYCADSQELYKGHFHKNYKEGKGVVEYPNKERFEGQFIHGLRNGAGCLMDASGRIFLKGTWSNDRIVGSA